MRAVVCDFCGVELEEQAWDFPADDVEYGPTLLGLAGPHGLEAVPERAVGSWIACPVCAELVNMADRDALMSRSANRHRQRYPEVGRLPKGLLERVIRENHDGFWQARRGPGRLIGREQLDLIALDPGFTVAPDG